jgi:hypothetical protein
VVSVGSDGATEPLNDLIDLVGCMMQAVAKVVPQILEDFFTVDQIMSLVLGEFVRTPLAGRPELMAHVLLKVLRQLTVTSDVAKWIIMCLNNFLQMSPFRYCVWALTCLFIAASANAVLQVWYYARANACSLSLSLYLSLSLWLALSLSL